MAFFLRFEAKNMKRFSGQVEQRKITTFYMYSYFACRLHLKVLVIICNMWGNVIILSHGIIAYLELFKNLLIKSEIRSCSTQLGSEVYGVSPVPFLYVAGKIHQNRKRSWPSGLRF